MSNIGTEFNGNIDLTCFSESSLVISQNKIPPSFSQLPVFAFSV